MNPQGTLPFGAARHTDPDTSHMAAATVDANRLEGLVLAAIRRSGNKGLIASEIVEETGLEWNTATPRLRPLVRKGLIYPSAEKRPGPSMKLQIVWKAFE